MPMRPVMAVTSPMATPVRWRTGPCSMWRFEVGGEFVGTAGGFQDAGDVAADVFEAFSDGYADFVDAGEVVVFQQARHCAAAVEPASELGALLVGVNQHLYGVACGHFVVQEGLDAFDGGDDAEGAVVFAALGNGVGVGTHADGGKAVCRAFLAGG